MILIMGPTGSGKSTLAKKIQEACTEEDISIISAGQWARQQFGITEHSSEAGKQLWELTREHLKAHPAAVTDWLNMQLETCRPCIVEGLRSGNDILSITKNRPYVLVSINGTDTMDGWEVITLQSTLTQVMAVNPPIFEINLPHHPDNPMLVNFLAEYILNLWSVN